MFPQSTYSPNTFFNPHSKKLYQKINTRVREIQRFLGTLNPSLEPVRKSLQSSARRTAANRLALENLAYYEGEKAGPYLSLLDFNTEKYKVLEDIAKKLIEQEAKEYFRKHNASNLFRPPKRIIRSFEAARRASRYAELGLIATHKGLPYTPFFDLLGLETVVLLNGFQPSEEHYGKKLLLVEDCKSKECLTGLAQKIESFNPAEAHLFLGGKRSKIHPFPAMPFAQIHTPKTTLSKKERQEHIKTLINLLRKKYKIFEKEPENF